MTRTTRRWRRKREEKIFECTICDFETESKTSLRKHLRQHTSRQKYECERCKRKCVNKDKYEQHVVDPETVIIRTSVVTCDYSQCTYSWCHNL